MAKIFAPNKQYTGISAGVAFAQGVGETTDEHLINWFENHGYEVEEPEEDLRVPDPDDHDPDAPIDLTTLTVEELTQFAEANGIDIGKATSKEGILKKIEEAAEKTEE